MVAQWLRCCAVHYGPGVDTASNTNKYQEHFMVVKAASA